MAPHDGLVHPKEYDIKDSNVELIGSDIDHKVKYNSAASEPAWSNAAVGEQAGLHVWRIEDFEVVPWPKDSYGQFYDGDSYIVLHSYKLGKNGGDDEEEKLGHDIFFWLGNHTTQDEAGTAAYKTVELDEYLHGVATQHREVQRAPSDAFLALFPRISIRKGGVRSGFHHVDQEAEEAARETIRTLLRIFKNPSAGGPGNGLVVHEVEPHWQSLDDADVFVLDDGGSKIWVWQGKDCSPMEKAKAAQVVHDMTLAKHVDTEVVSQTESRSFRVVTLLGGDEDTPRDGFKQPRPVVSGTKIHDGDQQQQQQQKLYRLSDASGQLTFELVKDSGKVRRSDLDGNDVFLLDDGGRGLWVWEGNGASKEEKRRWLQVAQAYLRRLQEQEGGSSDDDEQEAHLIPMAKVVEGRESKAFLKAIEV